MIIGSDTSFYQYRFKDATLKEITAYIDFAKMKTAAAFTIVRAGQGSYKDICFDISWKAAKDAGLPRGSYWFFDSRVPPQEQAELWISLLAGDLGELPLFCDFEDSYGGDYGTWDDWFQFIEALKRLAPGKEISIYTAYYYWVERTLGAGIPAASLNYFKQYPLWVANYGVTKPLIPPPWTDWTFWQFTAHGDGNLYGVESKNIDLNYFNGDLVAFRAKFNLGNTPSDGGIHSHSLLASLDDGTQIRFEKRG